MYGYHDIEYAEYNKCTNGDSAGIGVLVLVQFENDTIDDAQCQYSWNAVNGNGQDIIT